MCVAVFPDKVGLPSIQVNAVHTEILSSQSTDDFLDMNTGIVQFQAFLQDFMDVLYVQKDVLVAVGNGNVRHYFHQVPAEVFAEASAVAAGHDLLAAVESLFDMFRPGERYEMVHIIRMDSSIVDKLAEPAGEGICSIPDGSVFGTGLYDLVMVLCKIDPENLMICMADHLYVRRYYNDEGRNLLLPQGSDSHNICHFSERRVITEGLMLLPVSDGQKRAVDTGMISQFMAGHSHMDAGRYFLYPFVVV